MNRSLLLLVSVAVILSGCARSPLYSELTESQANEVQAALLMDAAGVYAGTEHPRVASLDEVENYLVRLSSK